MGRGHSNNHTSSVQYTHARTWTLNTQLTPIRVNQCRDVHVPRIHIMCFHRFITSHLCIDSRGSSILGDLFYTLCGSSLILYMITVSTNTEGLICMYANKNTLKPTSTAMTPRLADEEETPKSPWTDRRQRQTAI